MTKDRRPLLKTRLLFRTISRVYAGSYKCMNEREHSSHCRTNHRWLHLVLRKLIWKIEHSSYIEEETTDVDILIDGVKGNTVHILKNKHRISSS